MPNVNVSGMTVEALMDLRKRVDEMLHERGPSLKSNWRGWSWSAAQGLLEAAEAH